MSTRDRNYKYLVGYLVVNWQLIGKMKGFRYFLLLIKFHALGQPLYQSQVISFHNSTCTGMFYLKASWLFTGCIAQFRKFSHSVTIVLYDTWTHASSHLLYSINNGIMAFRNLGIIQPLNSQEAFRQIKCLHCGPFPKGDHRSLKCQIRILEKGMVQDTPLIQIIPLF